MARKVKVSPAAVKVLERMARSNGIRKNGINDGSVVVPGTGTCLEARFHKGKIRASEGTSAGIHARLADSMLAAGLIEFVAPVEVIRRVETGTSGTMWSGTSRRKYGNRKVEVGVVCPTAKGWNVLNDRKARKEK